MNSASVRPGLASLLITAAALSVLFNAGRLVAQDHESRRALQSRLEALQKLRTAQPMNWDAFEQAARAFLNDFPAQTNGYQAMMSLINYHQHDQPEKARSLARDVSGISAAPERYRLWAEGFLRRLDSMGKPVRLQFTALDGRAVDSTRLQGKVVLVYFWAAWCPPCVVEAPKLKAAYETFQPKGFEIIGISCDTDRNQLQRFIKGREIPWPQYFDGKLQLENKFSRDFGIAGIPHMLLLDRKGALRFDLMRTTNNFEGKIAELLAEFP